MATTASPAVAAITREGVPPRGPGRDPFLLRNLHSLSGVIPVGAFLVEHFVSNAFATRGPAAYAKQVELLSSFPFVFYLELVRDLAADSLPRFLRLLHLVPRRK